jgi:hypothetical protein
MQAATTDMEFLVPGFLLLLIAVVMVFFVIPRFGPLTTLIGAALLLTAGLFHHFKMFRFEYLNATWADRLKAYGPGILYFIMMLFITGFIFSMWSGGGVPVPEAAAPETPSPNNESNSPLSSVLPESMNNTLNVVKNTAANAFTGAANVGRQFVNNVRNYIPGVGPAAGAAAAQPPRNVYRNANFFSQY